MRYSTPPLHPGTAQQKKKAAMRKPNCTPSYGKTQDKRKEKHRRQSNRDKSKNAWCKGLYD